MTWLSVVVPLAAVGGWLVCGLLDWWQARRGRRVVQAVVERETGRHVARLVPAPRRSTEPQSWWEFVPQDGDQL